MDQGGAEALFKKFGGKNYFVSLMILLGVIFLLGITTFFLGAAYPGALGSAPPRHEIKEIYSFEPWSFEIGGLLVSYPEGGMIIPIFRENKQEALLIIGPGEYHSQDHTVPTEAPMGLYLDLDYDLFTDIRGDTLFMPVEDFSAIDKALLIYEKQVNLPVVWESGIPLVFSPDGAALYYYFIDSAGNPQLPPVIIEPSNNVSAAIALYALFIAVVLLTIWAFSLDHHPSRYWKFIHCARPQWPVAVAAIGAAGFALLGELIPAVTGLHQAGLALGYAAGAGILILLARLKWIDFLDFGVRPDTIKHGYPMVITAAALFLAVTRGFSGRISINGFGTLLDFVILFFLVALAREIIWRGFIQAALGRSFGPITGLIATAVLASLAQYIVLAVTEPWLLAYPYTIVETLILVPGTALVLGFIYMRTENIISSALLHCLILFLPRLIVY